MIYGFAHDKLQNGSNANITFGLKHLTSHVSVATTPIGLTRGYRLSVLSETIYEPQFGIGTIYNLVPEEIRNEFLPVIKYVWAPDNAQLTPYEYKMFAFAASEVFDSYADFVNYPYNSYPLGEGAKYPIFNNPSTRIRLFNGTTPDRWWLRSVQPTSSFWTFVDQFGIGGHSVSPEQVMRVNFGFSI